MPPPVLPIRPGAATVASLTTAAAAAGPPVPTSSASAPRALTRSQPAALSTWTTCSRPSPTPPRSWPSNQIIVTPSCKATAACLRVSDPKDQTPMSSLISVRNRPIDLLVDTLLILWEMY